MSQKMILLFPRGDGNGREVYRSSKESEDRKLKESSFSLEGSRSSQETGTVDSVNLVSLISGICR
jgi:hypothetical protein